MTFNVGFILLLIASCHTTTVHAVNDPIGATECSTSNRKKTCRFNATKLTLDTALSIDFVASNGMRIHCGKRKVRGDNAWYGICAGDVRDANFVRRKDRRGITQVFGSVHAGSDICQISPNAEGISQITCTATADFPTELSNDIEAPPDNRLLQNLHFGFHPTFVDHNATDALSSLRGNLHRSLYDDSGATIDVMVVWTKQAECSVSKLGSACTLSATTENNMRGLIDLAIAETNTAFQLSGILSTLRLVHAYRDPVYVEPTSTPYKIALGDLGGTTDGKLDDVHAKRALYGADMVQMLMSHGQSCGIAYLSSGRASTFSVINANCATGYYSYAHEIGHNFGMKHDRGTEKACNATTFNFGYRDPAASFRSILAYDCVTGECDNMPKTGCPRVQRFSNNEFRYNGKPIGNTYNDNAKQWNRIRAVIASHYPAMNCNSNSQCNDNNVATADTCNIAKAVCVFTPIVPTKAPIRAPSKPPTPSPTKVPTRSPTKKPTSNPTMTPLSKAPTADPTKAPATSSPTSRPTAEPTLSPTNVPTRSPTIAPTSTPTMTPLSKAPTATPTKAPMTSSPTSGPTAVPTTLPTKAPTNAPTKSPTNTPTTNIPTSVPRLAPTKIPTRAPTAVPTRAPTKAPTRAPAVPTPSYFMESKVMAGVTSSEWTTVTLTQNYLSPIPVCTVQYDTGNTLLPAVVRMQNVLNQSFQIRIQNPSNQVLSGRTVHCVIVEEGAYVLPDGRKIEGRKYRSTITDHDLGWSGEKQTYLNKYTNPIVVGQVMTYSDTRWSVFYSRGSTDRTYPPNAASLRCGKHLGEDTPITRLAEMLGYIVIEKGHASYSGTEVEFGRTPAAVVGYVNATSTTTFATPFASTPIVRIASQVGTKGREGSWAVVTGNASPTFMGVSVDEDQTFDTERSHPAEEVDYIAFTSVGAIQLTK